jgi:hypothetical protein
VAGNRRAQVIAAARAQATRARAIAAAPAAARAVLGQTALVAVAEETVSATAAYPQALTPAREAAHSVVLRVAGVEVARGRAVREARPVWEVPEVAVVLGAAAAGGGGSQSMNKEMHMKSKAAEILATTTLRFFVLIVLSCTAATYSTAAQAAQKTFATPKQAAEAFIQAVSSFDVPALKEILGPEGEDLVASEDSVQDKNRAAAFTAKAQEKNEIEMDPKNSKRAILSVGNDDWPLPIPIVKKGEKWSFDTKAGREEILLRRIGANELDTIQICRGYVEAQHEYATEKHDDAEVNQYAQRVISTAGKHDGLAWQNPDGSWGGPVGEGIAKAIAQGYSSKSQPYHGYYFKVLKGQGPAAPLGQMDFVVNGAMIGGFALAAAPADYRVTGVKTFIVSYAGVVYEKDLGPDTLNIFKSMELYNPDKTWHRTDDNW